MDALLQARLARNQLAVAFAQELIAELGPARALPLLARAVNRLQSDAARALAAQWGDNSLPALGEHFRRRAAQQGILEVLEASERRLALRVTRCPSTEAFRLLGAPELAPLFCASDHAFIKAYNPQIRLLRTQTIARGGDYCDHVWVTDEAAAPAGAPPAATDSKGGETMDARLQDRINRYEMAVAFARQSIEELGEDQAFPILRRAFEKMQVKNAEALKARLGSNSLEALAEHNRRQAAELDNFEVLEVTDRAIATKVTRCVAYEAFAQLGLPELCRLYCESDDAYIKAFNPQMKLIRTKMIAAGDAYCDHIWALEEE